MATPTTPAEHYDEALRLLNDSATQRVGTPARTDASLRANAHATLAVAGGFLAAEADRTADVRDAAEPAPVEPETPATEPAKPRAKRTPKTKAEPAPAESEAKAEEASNDDA